MKTENYFLNKKKKKRIRIQFIIKSFSIEVNFQQKKCQHVQQILSLFLNLVSKKLKNNSKSTMNKFTWTKTRLKFRIKIALM